MATTQAAKFHRLEAGVSIEVDTAADHQGAGGGLVASDYRLPKQLRLLQRACRLATGALAASLPALPTHAADLDETKQLIGEIQSLAETTGITPGDGRHTSPQALERQINDAFAALNRLTDGSVCQEPGRVYLDGPNGEILSSVQLQVGGRLGLHWLGFVSGTNLSAVAAAINTLTGATGVHAMAAAANPERLELASVLTGANQFVRVTQDGGQRPIVYAQPVGGNGLFSWTDYGCAFGLPLCAEAGKVFLSTGANLVNDGNGSISLMVRGELGSQQFTFASGTAQADLVAAVNTFLDQTGVAAAASPENPPRVRFASMLIGSPGFVRLQISGSLNNLLSATPFGWPVSNDLLDYGRDGLPGDVNCDWRVNSTDIQLIVLQWGACPPIPSVCAGDFDGNGVIDVDDLLTVINNWYPGW